MLRYLAITVLILVSSLPTWAIEYICPAKVSSLDISAITSRGWTVFGQSEVSDVTHLFVGVRPRDGDIGDFFTLIPDNDESGFKDGFWVWNVKGSQTTTSKLFVVCEYGDYGVALYQQITSVVKQCKSKLVNKRNSRTLVCL